MTLRIALVGMTGVGKTTVGKALADELSAAFRDLDKEIERIAGCTIPEFFAQYGESAFRDIEKEALFGLTKLNETPIVVATGGGAVLSETVRRELKEKYTTIWLVASPKTIALRLGAFGVRERPLLRQAGTVQSRLEELEANRRHLYLEVADFSIDVEKKAVPCITSEIMTIGRWQKCSE